MKQQINEIKRMQQLAGILKEDNNVFTISEDKNLKEASSKVGLTKQHQDQISDLSSEQKKKLYDDLTDAITEINDKDFKTKAEYAKAIRNAKIEVYKKYIKL